VLEVREARGDRMCQDALQELKMAIKVNMLPHCVGMGT
jgi:hypothetical protein